MTEEESDNIVNLMANKVGIVVLGCGHIRDKHEVKILYFNKMFNSPPGHTPN